HYPCLLSCGVWRPTGLTPLPLPDALPISDGVPLLGEVLGPGPDRGRGAGESVAEQHADPPAVGAGDAVAGERRGGIAHALLLEGVECPETSDHRIGPVAGDGRCVRCSTGC